LSDPVDKNTHHFKDAVAWSLPQIQGQSARSIIKPERKLDIDEVKEFESRIKKQIEAIKHEQENPTFLTVKQIEDIQQQAHDEAYEKAYKEAYDKGTKDAQQFLQDQLQSERLTLQEKAIQLQQCFNSLATPLADIDTEVEQQLTDTVFYFCKHILIHELTTDPSHILTLIQSAVSGLPITQQKVVIKLNPADIYLLKDNQIEIDEQEWKLEADESVAVGGCIVTTDVSSVDLNIEGRIKQLVEQLYDGLQSPSEQAMNLSAGQQNKSVAENYTQEQSLSDSGENIEQGLNIDSDPDIKDE